MLAVAGLVWTTGKCSEHLRRARVFIQIAADDYVFLHSGNPSYIDSSGAEVECGYAPIVAIIADVSRCRFRCLPSVAGR
jgi:hypothetical protein